jgi:hypothetical protein
VKGHERKWTSHGADAHYYTNCECGWSEGWQGFNARPATAWHAVHIADVIAQQRAFYARTEHCGACGQPGTYCVCTSPCGCADLHPLGAGLTLDALEQFAEADVEQPGLFG